MSVSDNNYDFLKEVKLDSLNKVRANFQFKFQGFNTLYVVDTFDIIEFCFPLVFSSDIHADSPLNISNFLAYEYFFFEYPNKHVVLEEYKIELYSFWHRVQHNIREFSNYDNLKDEMIAKYNSSKDKHAKIRFIESNIGMLLALAIGGLSNTPFDRFNSLITERLQLGTIDIDNKFDHQFIDEVFFNTLPQMDIVNQAFDYFCETTASSLTRLSEDELTGYLEGVYRDIKVFDRIVNINKKLASAATQNKLSQRYNVLYLSSVTKKTEVIESFYSSFLPNYEGIITNSIHRNSIELYIFQLLGITEAEGQKEKVFDLLEILESISLSYESNLEKIQKYKELFYDNIEKINLQVRNSGREIDDVFLKYHSISQHRTKIRKAINALRVTGKETDLLEQFTEVLNLASSPDKVSILSQIEVSLKRYNSLIETRTDVIVNYNYLSENKNDLKLQLKNSNDSVKSSIQSIPILLFYKKGGFIEIQKLFKHIIDPGDKNKEILTRLINTPRQLLYDFSAFEKKIFFLFVRYLFDPRLTDMATIAELEEYLEINKKNRLNTEFIEGENLHIHFFENNNIKNELLYFITWVLRRRGEYDKSIIIIDEYESQLARLDVRLHHSRALCYKSGYYKLHAVESVGKLVEFLEKALSDFFICETEYELLRKQTQAPILIQDILLAISNSIIDTYTKLYLLDNVKYSNFIPICRERLRNLKTNMPLIGFDFDMYLAFQHTEIDLEFCETLVAIEGNNMQAAVRKIQEANKRLENILMSPNFSSYGPFEVSKGKIQRLAKILLRK